MQHRASAACHPIGSDCGLAHRRSLAGVLALVLAQALTGWLALVSPPAQAQAAAKKATAGNTLPRVGVAVARLDSVWLQPEREAPATVVARNESKLSAETAGVLLRWTADVGAQVKRGELLAQIDPRDAELSLQRARAALAASNARLQLAQAQLDRSRELVAQGFFSQEAMAQRETEVALLRSEASSSQASLATAQRQLDKTSLRAPFDGSIKQRLAQTGEAVAPGTLLYVVTESAAAEVEASLSPADVAGLRIANDIRLEAAGGSHGVRLLRVSPTLIAPARTQTARLTFKEPASAPPPGTSGSLRWVESQPHLPPNLLVRRAGVLGVFVRQGEAAAAKARFVRLPDAQEGRANALPLTLGAATPIIVRGQAALQDGQPIELQN